MLALSDWTIQAGVWQQGTRRETRESHGQRFVSGPYPMTSNRIITAAPGGIAERIPDQVAGAFSMSRLLGSAPTSFLGQVAVGASRGKVERLCQVPCWLGCAPHRGTGAHDRLSVEGGVSAISRRRAGSAREAVILRWAGGGRREDAV